MEDLQEKLAIWTRLYQQCEAMERIVLAAKAAHLTGGPDPAENGGRT
jgi:hypothetical protein